MSHHRFIAATTSRVAGSSSACTSSGDSIVTRGYLRSAVTGLAPTIGVRALRDHGRDVGKLVAGVQVVYWNTRASCLSASGLPPRRKLVRSTRSSSASTTNHAQFTTTCRTRSSSVASSSGCM